MSKYEKLWQNIEGRMGEKILLSFDEIESICGFPLDHSFLTYKKELLAYGWQVVKISMKNKTVLCERARALYSLTEE